MLYEKEEQSGKRPRSQKKILRVSFIDGTVYCYKNATITFTEAVRKIGADRVADQMAWVRAANQHKAIAEEIILKELIYV